MAFSAHLVITYVIPNHVLSENEPQFVCKLSKSVCGYILDNLNTIMNYYPQEIGHTESYIKTSVYLLRHNFEENKSCWEKYVQNLK